MSKRKCSYPKCGRDHKGHGLCPGHLLQKRKGLPLTPLRLKLPGQTCNFLGPPEKCDKKVDAQGLCSGHYQQWRKGQELRPLKAYGRTECQEDGCERKHYCLGYCRKHYGRFKRHGDPGKGPRPSEIKDTGDHLLVEIKGKRGEGKWSKIDYCDRHLVEGKSVSIDTGGYAHFWQEGELLILHQLILPVPEGQQVDHIHGDRLDNRRFELRAVTFQQQMQNKKSWASSGHRNVHWSEVSQKWRVTVVFNKVKHLGGYFAKDDLNSAVKAAEKLRDELLTHHVPSRTTVGMS